MAKSRSRRTTDQLGAVALSSSLERNLAGYALTGAAGLGLLFSSNVQAAIKYTSARVAGGPNTSAGIDLNHDGIGDFAIHDYFSVSPGDTAGTVLASALNQNGVAVDRGASAHAFNFGDVIGPKYSFERSPIIIPMAVSAFSSEGVVYTAGEFLNQNNKLLGLKFSLNGETFYGWARVDLKSKGGGHLYYELVDYAYQTIPNLPIIAGDGIRKNAGSLGELALGVDGIQFWRGTSPQK